MLRVGTVFSGIGAFEHALELANIKHKIVFACDIDKFVKQSYIENFDFEIWYDNIQDLPGSKYREKLDIFVGGTPCQSFSRYGRKRDGLQDPRGNLIHCFVDLIDKIKPSIFIFENVPGILTVNNGDDWSLISQLFDSIGYTWYHEQLNASDFGIPQRRNRLFVVGFRERKKFDFPKPIGCAKELDDFLEKKVEKKYFLSKKGIKFVTKQKSLNKAYTQINGKIALCQRANQQFNWHGDFILLNEVEDEDKYIQKLQKAELSDEIVGKTRIRKLTPRECLRLMGFDDRFKIVVSDTQMYRQCGNSIVVNVLISLLKKIDFDGLTN